MDATVAPPQITNQPWRARQDMGFGERFGVVSGQGSQEGEPREMPVIGSIRTLVEDIRGLRLYAVPRRGATSRGPRLVSTPTPPGGGFHFYDYDLAHQAVVHLLLERHPAGPTRGELLGAMQKAAREETPAETLERMIDGLLVTGVIRMNRDRVCFSGERFREFDALQHGPRARQSPRRSQ
jgi:hypothetical protein